MTTSNGSTLVECASLAYGETTFFRAEVYGVLSIYFLSRMIEHIKTELTWQINSYLNNEGVII
eukprot:7383115-Ditylum_brightwellii.AAC.1